MGSISCRLFEWTPTIRRLCSPLCIKTCRYTKCLFTPLGLIPGITARISSGGEIGRRFMWSGERRWTETWYPRSACIHDVISDTTDHICSSLIQRAGTVQGVPYGYPTLLELAQYLVKVSVDTTWHMSARDLARSCMAVQRSLGGRFWASFYTLLCCSCGLRWDPFNEHSGACCNVVALARIDSAEPLARDEVAGTSSLALSLSLSLSLSFSFGLYS